MTVNEKNAQIQELAQQIIDYGVKMLKAGYVTGTGGNISVRVPGEEAYLISPSGMPYEELTVDDIVMINFAGEIIAGKRKPSVEQNMHRLILKNRPEFNAVIHTHSCYAAAYSSLHRPLPVVLDVRQCVFGGAVPCSEYARIGTMELAQNVEKAMRGTNVVLIANHGCIGPAKTWRKPMAMWNCWKNAVKLILPPAAPGYHFASATMTSGNPLPIFPKDTDSKGTCGCRRCSA